MKVMTDRDFPRGGLPDLEVVQVLSAGVDWVSEYVPGGVTLCNRRHALAELAAQALARAQMLRHRAGLPLQHVVSGPARPSR